MGTRDLRFCERLWKFCWAGAGVLRWRSRNECCLVLHLHVCGKDLPLPTPPTLTHTPSVSLLPGAQLMWNQQGTAALVLAYTEFDVTNQSYYGEQKLHFLPSDPSKSDKVRAGHLAWLAEL